MSNGYKLFFDGTGYLSIILLLAVVVVGIQKRNLFTKAQKWFWYYLVFVLVIELITRVLGLLEINNLFVYPFYLSGEFISLIMMFVLLFRLPTTYQYIVVILGILIFAESIYYLQIGQGTNTGIGKITSHILIVILSVWYLIQTLQDLNLNKRNPFTMIFQSLFFYYAVSIILFLLMPQLTNISMNHAYLLWGINTFLVCILYGISLITFLRLKN